MFNLSIDLFTKSCRVIVLYLLFSLLCNHNTLLCKDCQLFFIIFLYSAKFCVIFVSQEVNNSWNERLKLLRKTLKLSQDAFAERIGMKGSSISLLESGGRNITEQVIKSICREFNVDYIWLTTGDGEDVR